MSGITDSAKFNKGTPYYLSGSSNPNTNDLNVKGNLTVDGSSTLHDVTAVTINASGALTSALLASNNIISTGNITATGDVTSENNISATVNLYGNAVYTQLNTYLATFEITYQTGTPETAITFLPPLPANSELPFGIWALTATLSYSVGQAPSGDIGGIFYNNKSAGKWEGMGQSFITQTSFYNNKDGSGLVGEKLPDDAPAPSIATYNIKFTNLVNFGDAPAPPAPALTTYCVTTFLVNSPIYNTPYTTALNYVLNCDAVGGSLNGDGTVTGNQTFGSYYAKTAGTIPSTFSPPGPWDGKVINDFNSTNNTLASYTYLHGLQTAGAKVLVSMGGYYADVRGLWATPFYSVPSYPGGTQPSVQSVTRSLLSTFFGITGFSNPNPCNWSNAEWSGMVFDGLNLDFENIGYGGNPNISNTYPPTPTTEPTFPADAGDNQYASYAGDLVAMINTIYNLAPSLIVTQAPLSLAINADGLNFQGGRNIAISTALNTYFPFPSSTVAPTTANFSTNATSYAYTHPNQLCLFDDIFVQFYNATADYYPGGQYFVNILAQWGFVVLKAQQLGKKKTKINIGLAKGTIQGSTANPSIPSSQGPTAPLSPASPPYTYWYPQWKSSSPPNPNATSPAGFTFPNIGITQDDTNLNTALASANYLLTQSGLPNASSIKISDWCSGGGFWAGGNATYACKDIFRDVPNLPQQITYSWSDAQYPASNPQWAGNVPIVPST
jgi:hypothetical protein